MTQRCGKFSQGFAKKKKKRRKEEREEFDKVILKRLFT
jgi:hypothetical protein